MTELKHAYETILVVNAQKTQEEIDVVVDKFKTLIEKSATIDSVDVWGKRRLAYPINDLNEGYYVLINFTSDPDFPKELDRVYKITDGVLRTIIVRKDEKDTGAKAVKEAKETKPAKAVKITETAKATETPEEAKPVETTEDAKVTEENKDAE